METFLLCPGQGAQSIGMGRVWSESNTTVRDTLSEADSILGDQLGQPLTTLCFEGPAESLNQTNVAQPALFAVGVAVWRALAEQGHQLSGAAGLSLGEYTALVAAGAMDFADGLRVVAERGRLMQDAAVARSGGTSAAPQWAPRIHPWPAPSPGSRATRAGSSEQQLGAEITGE